MNGQNHNLIALLNRELLCGRMAVYVQCAVLDGEVICLAGDRARLRLDECGLMNCGLMNGAVVYRNTELARLLDANPPPEVLKTIHAAKKTFGGVYEGVPAWSIRKGPAPAPDY